MSDKNPLAYTGLVSGTTKVAGVAQFDPTDFTVTDGVVYISSSATGTFSTLTSTGATTLATTGASVNTFGNTTGATSVTISVGTGGFSLASAATGTIAIGSAAQTGTITLGQSTAGQTINVGAAVNVGAQVINLASGASGANSTVNILSGNGTAGTQTLNVLTGTRAGALNLATGAAAHAIAIGSASAGAVTVDTAAGISLDAATASNFTVTGAGIDLTLASVGGSVAINGSEAAATAISLTASDAAGGITLTAGTGDINLQSIDILQSISSAGNDLTYQITNSDNTSGTSRAGLELATGGASSGDPYINFLVSGAGVFTMGIDNSASDNFVWSASTALGTSDVLTLTSAGALTSAAGITATTGNIVASAGTLDVSSTARAQSFLADGDEGTGVASTVMFTNVVDETLSSGAGVVLMKTANAGNSSGWLKIYNGTDVRYVPYWTNISP